MSSMERLRKLALNLSSSDFVESQEARTELARFMAPENLINIWRQGEQGMAATLLQEAETVDSLDVYTAMGNGFKRFFDAAAGRETAEELLRLDTSNIVARFLVNGMAHEDLSRAACVRPALLGVMALLPPELAPPVGTILSSYLKNERVLRLFDEDRPESVQNEIVCNFLLQYTDLIPFITSATIDAFENDPLLVANYLMITCIISRHMGIPQLLLEKIEEALTGYKDEFMFCFVCHACATAVRNHEENASKYAPLWGVACSSRLGNCSNITRDAIYDILGALSTTASGWRSISPCVSPEEMMQGLGVTSLRPGVLGFMDILVQSPYVPDSFFSSSLLNAAWRFRVDADDVTRENLWSFINNGLKRENIMLSLGSLCASYLSTFPYETNVNVREVQLQIASSLIDRGGLSQQIVECLKQFRSRGLYPPASVGVEAMARD